MSTQLELFFRPMKDIVVTVPLPHQLHEAGKVILNAFREEAVLSSFIDLSRKSARESYYQVLKLKLALYHEAGHPLFTALSDGRVVGAVILNSPHVHISRGRLFRKALPSLPRMLGLLPYSIRAMRLGNLVRPPANLPETHYTLELLAVHRLHQGKGVGRLLLEHIARFCSADQTASGIYILTGDEKNRALYEKFGYRLWESRQGGALTVYHMFLENRGTVCR